ncbi:alpha/beta hydrolase [Ancylobacter pratisalsi]|uniref:Alpha/beta hydrolase n=1 Tax=Ancylobacter pratisalsi TaxID=1745854 RepID=A0A6P1YJS6_9HYPH|nr:alpha/beta hydrolase [Ancylobacter pratisalsi]QIB33549.1 alpha/beta hydrolase [Ancylobacter pratisalsi]
MREALLLALAALAGGTASAFFAPVQVLNALAGLEDHRRETDIAYGEGPRQRLDVYTPTGAGEGRPVVVFFYGGGWEEGERSSYRFVGAALASRGFVTVIADYRVYPQARFPDFIEDGARAVRWARDHAAGFGGDGRRLVLAGHSAGAHIAAMLSFDHQWLKAVGLDAGTDIAGMVGLAGPYDFLPLHSATLATIFGPEAQRARTQPITFVDGRGPPAFLATGPNDRTVDPGNTARLAARIRQHGGEVTTRTYDRADHRTLIGAFARPLRLIAPVLDDTAAFIRKTTGEAARS